MATYLTIPGEIESEEVHSYQLEQDRKSVVLAISIGDAANWLFRASAEGRPIELAVIMGDGLTLALDNVYVSSASMSSGPSDPMMTLSLDADEIRYIP